MSFDHMITLGIETSCDELGVAIIDWQRNKCWHILRSQIDLHAMYGGVVPEIAARDHVQHMPHLVQKLIDESISDVNKISHVAYTKGPGLIGALLTGGVFAASFAKARQVPMIGVNHLEAHIVMALMGQQIDLPAMILLTSGGHTMLMYMRQYGDYELLGATMDDAIGEAFDKVAKKMGLGYPGGPILEKMAKEGKPGVELPLPLKNRAGYDFSFSGLKTATIRQYEKLAQTRQSQCDIAYAFQETAFRSLVGVCKRALEKYPAKQLIISGGVSANKRLREVLSDQLEDITVVAPPLKLCTDNGLMIAYLGGLRYKSGQQDDLFSTTARWDVTELTPFEFTTEYESMDVVTVSE